jgi:hypothetical protein
MHVLALIYVLLADLGVPLPLDGVFLLSVLTAVGVVLGVLLDTLAGVVLMEGVSAVMVLAVESSLLADVPSLLESTMGVSSLVATDLGVWTPLSDPAVVDFLELGFFASVLVDPLTGIILMGFLVLGSSGAGCGCAFPLYWGLLGILLAISARLAVKLSALY